MLYDDSLLDDGQDDALIQATDRGERQARHQIQLGGNPLAAQRGRFRFVPKTFARTTKSNVWRARTSGASPSRARGLTHPSLTVGRCPHSRSTPGR